MLSAKSNRISTRPDCDHQDFLIRSFRVTDRPEVMHLYHAGLLAGRLDPNDQALDLVDIDASYLRRPQDHFWIAEANGSVIGTISISEDGTGASHIRRLRVAPLWQLDGSVSIALIRTAVGHARDHGCLKLIFHTSLASQNAIDLVQRLGFQVSRVRGAAGQNLIESYEDLYHRD